MWFLGADHGFHWFGSRVSLLFRLAECCVCCMLISMSMYLRARLQHTMRISYTIRFFLRCVYYFVFCFHLSRSSSRMSEIKTATRRTQPTIFFIDDFYSFVWFVCLFQKTESIACRDCNYFVYVFWGAVIGCDSCPSIPTAFQRFS